MKEKIIENLARKRDSFARLCLQAEELNLPHASQMWRDKVDAFNDAIQIAMNTH